MLKGKPEIKILKIPNTPPSLNEYARFGRMGLWRCHTEWKKMIWALCNESGNRIPRPCKFVKLEADIYFTVKRRRDETNYSATLWKLVLDGLVVAGIIPDDTAKFVEVSGTIGMLTKAEYPHTVVRMECYLS